MASWLKLLGKAPDQLLPDRWAFDRPDLLEHVRFGDAHKPTDISSGDELVYYGVGWQRIFALAVVASDEPYETTFTTEWEQAWPWVLDVRVTAKKRRLSEAPGVMELGTIPDLRHQGYVPLTAEQLAKAKSVITAN